MADLPAGTYPSSAESSDSPASDNSDKPIEKKLVTRPVKKATTVRQRKVAASPKATPKRIRKASLAEPAEEVVRPRSRPSSPQVPRTRKRSTRSPPIDSSRSIGTPLIVTLLKSLIDLLLFPLQAILSSVQSIIALVLCFVVLLGFLYYILRQPLTDFLSPLSTIHRIVLRNPTALYCNVIGIGCGDGKKKPSVDAIARTIAEQATQAHDIFESLSSMNEPGNLGLHHTEIWELAVAVSATSNLPSRLSLSTSLRELGDLTRDVKDRMITINSLGINSFSFTLQEFKRIEQTIQHIYTKTGPYTSSDISRQLDILFSRLGTNLDGLLKQIEATIPKADRASLLGGSVLEDFAIEHSMLLEQKENTPLWRALLDKNSFKGKQLSRDLDLAEISIDNLKSARSNLEEARRFLLQYRDNVAYFKASVIGYHIADHGLSPEHEVLKLGKSARALCLFTKCSHSAGSKSTLASFSLNVLPLLTVFFFWLLLLIPECGLFFLGKPRMLPIRSHRLMSTLLISTSFPEPRMPLKSSGRFFTTALPQSSTLATGWLDDDSGATEEFNIHLV